MITKFRTQFNEAFSEAKYHHLQELLAEKAGIKAGFRFSESPIFLTREFQHKIFEAADSIIAQIEAIPTEALDSAIPKNSKVPGDASSYHFLAIDFGICVNPQGQIEPQLIELQAFPSLFAFQHEYETELRKLYPFLNDFQRWMPEAQYVETLRKIIVGDENPENVVLLEIYPEKQKTNIDFYLTEKLLGIKTLCITQIIKEGRHLFYEINGRKIPIKRIYNRIIFDELFRYKNLKTQFHLTDDVEVKWITHPDWFFKISKNILPKLKHSYIPETFFLSEAPEDLNLEDYVLKPLYSFAGSGINLHASKEDLANIEDKDHYILQKKVQYAPIFKDIRGDFSKAEVRLLYAKAEGQAQPTLMTNLVRMTKAEMVNVDFNKKDAIWIGSTMAFFEGDQEKPSQP